MIKTSYQTPELRNANDEIIQNGAFGKNTALSNATNDGWIDYVMNNLEALHNTVGASAPTLDGNGHVVEPANLAIGDEDGLRIKTNYLKKSGGTLTGALAVRQRIRMQDNQENEFGGLYVPPTTASQQFMQVYGGETPATAGVARLTLRSDPDNHSFSLVGGSADGSTDYFLSSTGTGQLTWRGNELAKLASPAFTGNPTAPTQSTNNNSTRLATTAFVANDLKVNSMLLSDTFATQMESGDDLNDFKTAGTYIATSSAFVNSLINCPVNNTLIKLVVLYGGRGSTLYEGRQILFSSNSAIYTRKWNGGSSGSWGAWTTFAYAENVLPLSGGTLTGALRSQSTLGFSFQNLEKGTNPETASYPGWMMTNDKNGYTAKDRICGVGGSVDTNGDVNYGLIAYKYQADSTAYEGVYLTNPLTGDPSFRAGSDNNTNLGRSTRRWKQLYAATATINTSDERVKDNIESIPDAVLDAWGEVNWYQFQFKDAIAEKGATKARIHTGSIAQRIESVFTAHGLDANRYGLLCYDEWSATPVGRDEQGNIIEEAQPAGNRYSLRYEEALCMEAAYQRRRADRLEARIEALERAINHE